MPRRAASSSVQQQQPQASTSTLGATAAAAPPANDPVSLAIAKLRKTWKFAALCQFIFTFEEAFGLSGFKSQTLEYDLAAATYTMIPDLMKRLLYTLTLDKRVNLDNWQEYLRAQYQRRLDDEESPAPNPMGTIEEPRQWESLTLVGKVRTIHDLCEWQLGHDAERFRKLLRSEEDVENWRVYPIGYDSKDNTYWLFDDNRLWVQHPPPPKPKGKALPKKNSKKAKAEAAAAKRKAAAEAARQKKLSAAAAPKGRSASSSNKRTASLSNPTNQDTPNKRLRTSGRSSMGGSAQVDSEVNGTSRTASRGTRSSRRFADSDAELLNIPPELQDFNKPPVKKGSTPKPKVKEEAESDLSDAPSSDDVKEADEDDDNAAAVDDSGADQTAMDIDGQEPDNSIEIKEEQDQPTDQEVDPDEESWIEYETVAVTKAEWEAIALRFAKSKHPDEKALHIQLRDEIVPKVLSDIVEAEKAAALEAALASRKRSSRIAMKESEKEEKEREVQARVQMEERMRAIRKEEEDKVRKEQEALREERRREDRLREREERIRAREQEAEDKALREIQDRERKEKMREMRQRKREMIANGEIDPDDVHDDIAKRGSGGAGANIDGDDEDEDWDLRCEICHKAGRNPDLAPDEEIVCCESCLVWQHTKCWEAFDSWSSNRSPRSWDEEDFFCTDCKAKKDPQMAEYKNKTQAEIAAYRRAKGLATDEEQIKKTKKIVVKQRSASGTPGGGQGGGAGSPPPRPHHAAASPPQHPMPTQYPYYVAPPSGYGQPYPPPYMHPGHGMSPSPGPPTPMVAPPSHPTSSRPIVPTSANGGTPNKPLLSLGTANGQQSQAAAAPPLMSHAPYAPPQQHPLRQGYVPNANPYQGGVVPQAVSPHRQYYPAQQGMMPPPSQGGAHPHQPPPPHQQHHYYQHQQPHLPQHQPHHQPHLYQQLPPQGLHPPQAHAQAPANHHDARTPPQSPGPSQQSQGAMRQPQPDQQPNQAPSASSARMSPLGGSGSSSSPSAVNGVPTTTTAATAPKPTPTYHRPGSSSGGSGGGASANKAPTGSFPIRRPNSSIARSPLSGPSHSPSGPVFAPGAGGGGGGGGVPTPMSLGEAAARVRHESPTPAPRLPPQGPPPASVAATAPAPAAAAAAAAPDSSASVHKQASTSGPSTEASASHANTSSSTAGTAGTANGLDRSHPSS